MAVMHEIFSLTQEAEVAYRSEMLEAFSTIALAILITK